MRGGGCGSNPKDGHSDPCCRAREAPRTTVRLALVERVTLHGRRRSARDKPAEMEQMELDLKHAREAAGGQLLCRRGCLHVVLWCLVQAQTFD